MTTTAVPEPSPLERAIAALRDGIVGGTIPPGTYLAPAVAGREHAIPTAEANTALAILRDEGIVWMLNYRRYAAPAGPPDPAVSVRLGRLLARMRDEAGLSPEDLSKRALVGVHEYSRAWPGTIREAEGGEWQPREFWAAVDAGLSADGTLLKIHDRSYAAPAEKREPEPGSEPDPSCRTPSLVRVTAEIRARVAAGEWPPGTPVPGKMALARHHGTSSAIIGLALSALRAEGFLDGPRAGYWVPEFGPQPDGRVLAAVVLHWSDGTTTPVTVRAEPAEAE